MLTPERIERLRGYLLEEQANLQQQLASLAGAAQEANVGLGNHMAEDATAAFDQASERLAASRTSACPGAGGGCLASDGARHLRPVRAVRPGD